MARSFVIRSTFGRPRWWRVVIHDTVAELREAAFRHRPWLGREHWDGVEGCCHPAGRNYDDGRRSYPRNGYCGIVRLAAPSLTSEIAAHELVHAAAATLRTHGVGDIRLGDGYRGSNLREEQLAYLYGELFADFDRQL